MEERLSHTPNRVMHWIKHGSVGGLGDQGLGFRVQGLSVMHWIKHGSGGSPARESSYATATCVCLDAACRLQHGQQRCYVVSSEGTITLHTRASERVPAADVVVVVID